MRKISLILLPLILLNLRFQAQITVNAYAKEIKCDVDGLAELQPLTATSTAGNVQSKYSEEIFSGGCLGTLVRTFNFTDAKGNTAMAQQFVSITDNQSPIMYGEAPDISTTADMIPPPASFASRDNSGKNYDVVLTETKEKNKIIRVWTCSDSCGNTSSKTQVITIE